METNQCEFQTQLKEADSRRGPGISADATKACKFEGTTSWAVFQCQSETIIEHNCWTHLEKYTYLITALHGWATDVLHRAPKGETYEETLEALEDRFED
jgi:hypothetical protein